MVSKAKAASADGLVSLLESSLQQLGAQAITESNYKNLVGLATDGVSANIAAVG